ncbi:hypothetical protein PC9H_000433 [Pleurotus ostreatus]|uniref:Alpha-type protein kinase domain-containing protein n=1 Tax=Pleurotus ostreatus TaxID=5322 RepID=A0A8H7DWU0_PLEOS|nr:uncharacterized protein PC9H_000433 [Pleurotus ostreatus]KAF7440090.1 hypothetical protein PC9H_000433 [Pleurotus ostreatus]
MWPQCQMCGVTRRNMPPTGAIQICGAIACHRQSHTLDVALNDEGHAGQSLYAGIQGGTHRLILGPLTPSAARSTNISDANQARIAATRTRLKHVTQTTGLGPTTHLSTATLQQHQHGGGAPGEPKTLFCFQVRVSNNPKKINDDLGSSAIKFANSVLMIDAKAQIVKNINTEWTRVHSSPLLSEEVSYRFAGNRLLHSDTLTLNVGDFYGYYSSPANASIYIDNVPKFWQQQVGKSKQKHPVLCFDMYVDYDAYSRRINGDENDGSVLFTAPQSRKRLRADSRVGGLEQSRQVQKRGEHFVLHYFEIDTMIADFSSSFNLSRASQRVERSMVTLKKTTCVMDPELGTPIFTVADLELSGYVSNVIFATGTMKVAYELVALDGSPYILKRFFRLCEDDSDDVDQSMVSAAKNEIQVKAEITRLAWGNWFLQVFYKYCKTSYPGVSVNTDIIFTNAFLAKEITSPTPASGVESNTERITWIAEPKRASTVTKFSGTLAHRPQRRNMSSQTIYAFAHFVWGHSNRLLVFADIQGTPTRIKGKDGLVLFDVMTHTLDGDSGVGDCAITGIESFLDDHRCLDLCKQLGLTEIPLVLKPTALNSSRRAKDPETHRTDSDGSNFNEASKNFAEEASEEDQLSKE